MSIVLIPRVKYFAIKFGSWNKSKNLKNNDKATLVNYTK